LAFRETIAVILNLNERVSLIKDPKVQRLRELRLIAGATQFDVERLSRVSRTRVSLAECGHVQLSKSEYCAVEGALFDMIEERASQLASALKENQHEHRTTTGTSF